MRSFFYGFALMVLIGSGSEAFAATYEVKASTVTEIKYSHPSHYTGLAWYEAKNLDTGHKRYFRRPVELPKVNGTNPLAVIPDAKKVGALVKSSGTGALAAAKFNAVAIGIALAVDAAGYWIDELSGQVMKVDRGTGYEDFYWSNRYGGGAWRSHEEALQTMISYHNQAPALASDPITCLGSDANGCYAYEQYFRGQNNEWYREEVKRQPCAGNSICEFTYEIDTPVPFDEVEPFIQGPLEAATEEDLARVFTDENGQPYPYQSVIDGAGQVASELAAEGHAVIDPLATAEPFTHNGSGELTSTITPSSEYDPNSPTNPQPETTPGEFPTDYARENTLQDIRDELTVTDPLPADPVLDLTIPELPETDWNLQDEHTTFWSWLRGTFPFSLLTSPLAAIVADTPPAPEFCYTAVGISDCASMSMWDPLFSALRFAEGLLLIFGFYLVVVRSVMRFGG